MNRFVEQYSILFSVILLVVFAAVAVAFSYHQNLWVDESTQLSGLTLSIADMYRWLGGMIETPFVVPSDRAPMLSYLVGYIWGHVFGFDVLVMRWLSVFLVMAGLLSVLIFLFKKKQYVVLLAAMLLLCLSPNLTVIAVEIRSYALFFLLSTIAIILYLDIIFSLDNGDKIYKKIILLSFVLVLAINTHFFGLVLCGSIFLTYLLTSLVDKRFVVSAKFFWTVFIVVGFGVVFIVFPVLASFTSQAGGKPSESIIKPAVKLIYRLVAHQSMSEISFFPYAALLIFYATIAASFIKRITLVKISLLLILAAGFGVVFLANIFLSSFDALAPHYNIWMLPIVALLFGFCVADLPLSKVSMPLLLLAICMGFGQYQLAVAGEKYAHTRFDQIEQRVNDYRQQGQVSVIYNRSMAKTWFAGAYRFPADVNQYVVTPEGYSNIMTGELTSQSFIESANDIIMVAYGENVYSQDLVSRPSELPLPSASPVYSQISLSEQFWQLIDAKAYTAQESADVLVYKKTP